MNHTMQETTIQNSDHIQHLETRIQHLEQQLQAYTTYAKQDYATLQQQTMDLHQRLQEQINAIQVSLALINNKS